LPALQSFCLYAAIGILGLYLLQCTFFTAWFVLDCRRVESKRNGILCCCYKHGDDYEPAECSKKDITNLVFDKVISKALITLPVKVRETLSANSFGRSHSCFYFSHQSRLVKGLCSA
jgi:hypothetical protein